MTEFQHQDAARGRWQTLTLAEQFGNVGSEISRAIRWSTKNPETAQKYFDQFALAARRAHLAI